MIEAKGKSVRCPVNTFDVGFPPIYEADTSARLRAVVKSCWLALIGTAWACRRRGSWLRRPAQDTVALGVRGGGAGGTSLAATTSGRAITTSERRVRIVHSPSDFPTSSPSASVRPASMRYLTTTRMPRGALERKCWGTGIGEFTPSC
jgi:hypothetical protein